MRLYYEWSKLHFLNSVFVFLFFLKNKQKTSTLLNSGFKIFSSFKILCQTVNYLNTHYKEGCYWLGIKDAFLSWRQQNDSDQLQQTGITSKAFWHLDQFHNILPNVYIDWEQKIDIFRGSLTTPLLKCWIDLLINDQRNHMRGRWGLNSAHMIREHTGTRAKSAD